MDDLNILPPDKDVFHAKKQVSKKQGEHLARARESARKTIENRRALEAKAKLEAKTETVAEPKSEPLPDIGIDPDVGSESEPEMEVLPPKITRQSRSRAGRKIVELSEEEADTRRFGKFMKQMKAYEDMKVQHAKDVEEAKKVNVSFTQAEYDHMIQLLDGEKSRKELSEANPVVQSKTASSKPRLSNMRRQTDKEYQARFG